MKSFKFSVFSFQFAICVLCVICGFSSPAATVYIPWTTLIGTPLPNARVIVTPTPPLGTNGLGGFYTGDQIYASNDITGLCTLTNVAVGSFSATVYGPNTTSSVSFTVTNYASTNFVVAISTVPTNSPSGASAYTMAASDARYLQIAGGNGVDLTNLNATNLTGVVPFTNGGFGQSLGTNWVPAGAHYDDGSVNPEGDPQYLIFLKAGVEYQVIQNGDANFQGITDQTETQVYINPSQALWTFTAPTNGQYILLSSQPSVPVLAQVYAVSNISLPVSPLLGDVVANSLRLANTVLQPSSGGTGTNSISGFAGIVGSQYNSDTANYPWDSTWAPSYAGQLVSQNPGGSAQATMAMVATGTGARQGSNFLNFPYGATIFGNPGKMPPNLGTGMEFFINGNPRDQTNTAPGDSVFRFWNMNPYLSGAFVCFPTLSTNSALPTTGNFPNWYVSGKVTNAAGTVIHILDPEASSFGMVQPDSAAQLDLPGTALWVVNGGGVYNTTNFSPAIVISLNGAINGLTAGNYSMFRVDPNHGLVGTQLVKDKAWNPSSNNWVWAQVCDYVLGRVTNCNLTVQTNFFTPSVTFSAGPTQTTGSGSPNTVVTAVVGSTYYRTDGGAGTTLYVKESGTGNTGWVGK